MSTFSYVEQAALPQPHHDGLLRVFRVHLEFLRVPAQLEGRDRLGLLGQSSTV